MNGNNLGEATLSFSFFLSLWWSNLIGKYLLSQEQIPSFMRRSCFRRAMLSMEANRPKVSVDGWMISDFTSFLIVYQSYQDDGS